VNFENARNLFFEGLDLLAREDYAGAEGKLRAAERLAPERVSVLTNLSAALLRQDKVAESKRYAEKSVALDESNAEGWLNLGHCLRNEGDLAAALQCCERSVALKPDYVEAWSNRGGVLLDLQRYAEALADCERAIALRPDHPQAWSNRGLALNALPGASFASRVAASLLQAIGLPELITGSPQEYEALALSLANDPGRLSSIREKLARNRGSHPLFDTALFARHMEAAYSAMWERHRAGLPPDHIQVPA